VGLLRRLFKYTPQCPQRFISTLQEFQKIKQGEVSAFSFSLSFRAHNFAKVVVVFQAVSKLAKKADHVGAINILSRGMNSLMRDEGQDMADASARCGKSTARMACEASGAAMPPAAGIRRRDQKHSAPSNQYSL